MKSSPDPRWLLLIHQLPPKPAYLRVKVWRQLQRLGAISLKNSVYVLPCCDQGMEDFQWVLRSIPEGAGEALVCEARLVQGMQDPEIEELFRIAREEDYQGLAGEVEGLQSQISRKKKLSGEATQAAMAALTNLKRRFQEIQAIDFFVAPSQTDLAQRLASLEAHLIPSSEASSGVKKREAYRGRTWATRKGIHVDRMACAWLIRRFIDPDATFKYVPPKGYVPEPGELRFDMFEAEFTHEGDLCSFEVMVSRFKLKDPGLKALAEIIHDIDLKESKYGRPETPGFDRLVAGIAMGHSGDEERLARASAVLDDLYTCFNRKA